MADPRWRLLAKLVDAFAGIYTMMSNGALRLADVDVMKLTRWRADALEGYNTLATEAAERG